MTAVAVEELEVGATIVLPNHEPRRVTAIERYDDGIYVVVYACNVLNSWDRGRWVQTTIDGLEKTLRPLRAGETVKVWA